MKLDVYRKFYEVNDIVSTVKLFQKTIIATNRTPEFYVDWKKVQKNLDEIKIELALWNSLINSSNIEDDFKKLITEYPEVIKTIPILHAIREREFPVIIDFHEKDVEVKHLNFNKTKYSKLAKEEIDGYIEFSQKSGIFVIFKHIKNFYDYVFGVEVGLDTNARKNRSGNAMENLLTPILSDISKQIGAHLLTQKEFNSVTIYGGHPPLGLVNRTSDYIIFKENKYVNIEVNYFSGAGSKPEEIVDSYINRKNELQMAGWGFIWVTDGDAWTNSENQIRKAFTDMDYVLNIQFIRAGLLKEALTQLLS